MPPSRLLLTTCALLAFADSASSQSEFETYSAGLPSLGYASFIADVSADGRMLLNGDTLPSLSYFLLQEGQFVDLPMGIYVPQPGHRISADGRVVVGTGESGGDKAIYWQDANGPFELTQPAGALESSATAVNADGSVIAGVAYPQQGIEVVRWVNDVPQIIDLPPPATSATFLYITPDGSHMAGDLRFPTGTPVTRAVRWSESAGFTMLELPPGSNRSQVAGQSADGQLTVGTLWPTISQRRAVAWDSAGVLIELHEPAWPSSLCLGIDAAGSKAVLRVDLPASGATYIHDFATGQSTPLVDVLLRTGGPSLAIEEVIFPQEISADGSTVVGNVFGDFTYGDYELWSARINGFGQKVCGPAAASSVGTGASLLGAGTPSVSSNTATLTAVLLPPGKSGMFLASQTLEPTVFQTNPAILCLGGDIGRFVAPGQVGTSGADGTLSLDFSLGSIPQPMGSVAAMPGEVWYFQAWFRDNDPLPTTNFTDALAVTFVP